LEIVIDDQNEVNKILKEQLDWYKDELNKSYEGYKYFQLVDKIVECIQAYKEDEDYDEYIAISDIKYWLKSYKLIE